tara:strand:- start:65 stop:661 length:597 start_codon:yes stop_codon:yes gene_type:complete
MGRRLGAKRLNSLERQGISFTGSAAGAGVTGSIGYRRINRDGNEILTEIYVDLGSATDPLSAPGATAKIIGKSIGGNAHLIKLNQAENGIITAVEMVCVEAPTGSTFPGGPPDIDLVYASGLKEFSGSTGTALCPAGGALVLGSGIVSGEAGLDTNALRDQYLYLQTGGTGTGYAAGEYTTGKLVIRLYGAAVPSDVL